MWQLSSRNTQLVPPAKPCRSPRERRKYTYAKAPKKKSEQRKTGGNHSPEKKAPNKASEGQTTIEDLLAKWGKKH